MLYVAIPLVLIFGIASMWGSSLKNDDMTYSEFVSKIENQQISSFTLNIASGEVEYVEKGSKIA